MKSPAFQTLTGSRDIPGWPLEPGVLSQTFTISRWEPAAVGTCRSCVGAFDVVCLGCPRAALHICSARTCGYVDLREAKPSALIHTGGLV